MHLRQVSFSEFKSLINEKKVEEAIIKEQSNTVHFEVVGKSKVFKTEYPEGFEGEVFQLLVDEEIELSTDTETCWLSGLLYSIFTMAIPCWLHVLYVFSSENKRQSNYAVLVNPKLKKWTKKLLRSHLVT